MQRQDLRRALPGLLALVLAAGAARSATAHAILIEARPAANATVAGPDVAFRLRFNSRLDGARSRLSLVRPDKSTGVLALDRQETPQVLAARARGLARGAYRLRWQVLAADGHVTRGEIPFRVQ